MSRTNSPKIFNRQVGSGGEVHEWFCITNKIFDNDRGRELVHMTSNFFEKLVTKYIERYCVECVIYL